MLCIFCFPNRPVTDLSREHVVPEAIGGSLLIGSVCKTCNDRLGSEVDVHLVENFLIKMIRLGLRLPARDGTIPTPLINGRLVGTDEVGSFRLPVGAEKGIVTVRPRIVKRVNESGNVEKQIIAERDEFEKIRRRLEARAERDGQEMVFRGPEETTVASPVIEKTKVNDLSQLGRPFLKIAFEYAVLQLGDAYVSTDSAAQLRRDILGSARVTTKVGFHLAPIGTLLSSGPWPSYFHAIRLTSSHDQIVCNLRIFNIFESTCTVATGAEVSDFSSPPVTFLDPVERASTVANGTNIAGKCGTSISIDRLLGKLVITTRFEGAETGTSTVSVPTAAAG
jgi:HNH endonuclease